MGLISGFQGKVIALDTAPLIYFLEERKTHIDFLNRFFEANANGDFLIITSAITLLEILVFPYKKEEEAVVQLYQEVLSNSPGIQIISVRSDIASNAAEIRARYNFRTPDAIQIATAVSTKADFFLTNDRALKRVTELEVIVLSELPEVSS